jgi:hypothetical protein
VQLHIGAAVDEVRTMDDLMPRVDRGEAQTSPPPRHGDSPRVTRGRGRARSSRLGGDPLAGLGLAHRGRKTPPFIAPARRMCRTSARVSTPVIPGEPQSISQ